MSLRSTILLVAVPGALVLGGCSSSDDGTAQPDPSTPAPSTTSATTTAPTAGGDVEAWTKDFCVAVAPALTVASSVDPSQADLSSPGSIKTFIVDFYNNTATAFQDSASAVSDLGAPPVDGAENFVPRAKEAFTQAGNSLQALADDAQTVDITDPAALRGLTEGLASDTDPIGNVFDEVDATTPPELRDALETVPECTPAAG